jgi:dienelactone hydrolase
MTVFLCFRNHWSACARALLGAALAIMLLTPARVLAGEPLTPGEVGLLWLPDGEAPPTPIAVVIALHEAAGIDPRGWRYGDQITAAGIAVLHVELQETSADGFAPLVERDAPAAEVARLRRVIDLVAADPRFAQGAIGLLAFGAAGQAAINAAADTTYGPRVAALALLYPGCTSLAATVATERLQPRLPILLLSGDSDEANPPADCVRLADQLAPAAPVRHVQYAGAGYAWDLPPAGPYETFKMPWPGRPGSVVAVNYWPKAAELSATQAASFFAATLTAPSH